MNFLNFWSEKIWLPENVQWKDFEPQIINGTKVHFPQISDLHYSLVAGVALLSIRIFIECFVLLPIAVLGGWVALQPNQSLFELCLRHFNFGFAGKGKFKKVSETAWRLIFYSSIFFYGIYVLWDQPQLRDLDESWRNYPFHPINDAVWYYYIIETGFYWSLLLRLLNAKNAFTIDVRRSDFWEMAVHHLITILLLSMSFSINFVRVGTMVLLCHDTADIFLEFGKLMRYARWETALTIAFCVFFAIWVATRVILFPLVIIRSCLVAAPDMIQKNYNWLNFFQRPIVPRLFVIMMCLLLALHVFWTVLLFRIAYKSTQKGGEVDDIREDSDEDEDVVEKKKDD